MRRNEFFRTDQSRMNGIRAIKGPNSGAFSTPGSRPRIMRVFPLSNWTELDVWEYIRAEGIPVVPLYFAEERPVVIREGSLIMVDDHRMPLMPGEVPMMRQLLFRTLGCYPLTGAIESQAATLDDIIAKCAPRPRPNARAGSSIRMNKARWRRRRGKDISDGGDIATIAHLAIPHLRICR